MSDKHRTLYLTLLAITLGTGLASCGPAPLRSLPSASANPNAPAQTTSRARPSPSNSSSPGSPATGTITVHLQADRSLAGFATSAETPLTLCLGQIAKARTHIVGQPDGHADIRAIELRTLLAGVEITLSGVPLGSNEGRTTFFDAGGTELGFVSWQVELAAKLGKVGVTLKATAETRYSDNCPNLGAAISGGKLLGAGGKLVAAQPSPGPVAAPTSAPTAGPSVQAPDKPTGLLIVEKTSSSLTLQWAFATGPTTYNLYLDGQLIQTGHATPDYYRFEGLKPDTSHSLGVQAVTNGGSSALSVVSATTLGSGHSGSGNFSGGGSSRPRPKPTPEADDEGALQAQFSVNSYTTSTQSRPVVASDADGDFVIVWQSQDQDGSGDGIYAQRYASTGQPAGSEFQVHTYTTNGQFDPHAAMDATGNFVVVWGIAGIEDDTGIYVRRFASGGNALGDQFLVNTYTESLQHHARVAIDRDGDFVVTWMSDGRDGDQTGIAARRFGSDGNPLGSEFLVNLSISSNQVDPSVATDDQGNFVITWASPQNGIFRVLARQYDNTGTPVSGEIAVDSQTGFEQLRPRVAMDSDGDFVIVWFDSEQDGSQRGVYARRFTSEGGPVGGTFQVNSYTNDSQVEPEVAIDDDGDFVIAWSSYYQLGEAYGSDIFVRRYHSDGSALGREFAVNSDTAFFQLFCAIAIDANGDFVTTWSTPDAGYGNYGIAARRFERNP
ncbi:MAG: hypothetical protein ACAI44_19770 [Candidatus Sericytochromatia bacterium]